MLNIMETERHDMKYLFDMGEVWHVYADVGDQWIYNRMECVSEEMLDKKSDVLPGPLGKLDLIQQLEKKCRDLETERNEVSRELEEIRKQYQQAYTNLQKMAEEIQKEGKQWRQKYLDLAYQTAHKKV